MAKKGTFNGPFFNNFASRLHGTPIKFGVLIGTEADDGQRDLVFAAPTPPQPAGEEGEAPAPAKDVAALLKSKCDGASFADWAVEHARAVRKLLPGGVEPCGCFAVASEAAAKDLAPLLAPVLRGVSEPFVLTIDPASRKLSFWQFAGGAKPALRPAQLKADPHKDALLLWCATPVDLVVASPDAEDAEAVSGAISRGLAQALEGCTVGVSARSAPLGIVDFGSEAALSAAAPGDCGELRVQFLHGGSVLASAGDAGQRMRQRCLIVSAALVMRRNMELRHAVDLVRKGLVASAAERLQLALEEAEGAEGPMQLPWRALCCPGESELPLWCGDYCMPDEAVSAARERLSQLLGLPEGSFREAPEHLSEQARLARDFKGTYEAAPVEQRPSKSGQAKGSNIPALACAAAVGALILAAAIPMLLR